MFESLKSYDRDVFLWLNGHNTPVLDSFMFYVSAIWVFFPLFMYWIYLVIKHTDLKKSLILLGFLGLLVVCTDQSSNQIKHAVKRYRPTHNLEIKDKVHTVNDYRGGQYGFFSGHSTNMFGIATLLYLLFSKRSMALRISFFLFAMLVAYSRIYLGVHYPLDILVGFFVGVFWGVVIYKLMQFTFKKYYHETVNV